MRRLTALSALLAASTAAADAAPRRALHAAQTASTEGATTVLLADLADEGTVQQWAAWPEHSWPSDWDAPPSNVDEQSAALQVQRSFTTLSPEQAARFQAMVASSGPVALSDDYGGLGGPQRKHAAAAADYDLDYVGSLPAPGNHVPPVGGTPLAVLAGDAPPGRGGRPGKAAPAQAAEPAKPPAQKAAHAHHPAGQGSGEPPAQQGSGGSPAHQPGRAQQPAVHSEAPAGEQAAVQPPQKPPAQPTQTAAIAAPVEHSASVPSTPTPSPMRMASSAPPSQPAAIASELAWAQALQGQAAAVAEAEQTAPSSDSDATTSSTAGNGDQGVGAPLEAVTDQLDDYLARDQQRYSATLTSIEAQVDAQAAAQEAGRAVPPSTGSEEAALAAAETAYTNQLQVLHSGATAAQKHDAAVHAKFTGGDYFLVTDGPAHHVTQTDSSEVAHAAAHAEKRAQKLQRYTQAQQAAAAAANATLVAAEPQ